MKNTLLLLMTLCSFLALSSCQKSGINLFTGDYSYKTTGTVTVQRQPTLANPQVSASFDIELPSELGQLQIATLDRKEDSVIVVINQLNGDILVTHGRCEDDEITLCKFQHDALTLSVEGNNDLKFPVTIKGTGHIYDGETIIFDLEYKGKAQLGDLTYNLKGTNIKMVAYRN